LEWYELSKLQAQDASTRAINSTSSFNPRPKGKKKRVEYTSEREITMKIKLCYSKKRVSQNVSCSKREFGGVGKGICTYIRSSFKSLVKHTAIRYYHCLSLSGDGGVGVGVREGNGDP
jgi:hypothetical protein